MNQLIKIVLFFGFFGLALNANKPEPDRYISLADFYGEFNYNTVFSESERAKIDDILSFLKNPEIGKIIESNFQCFGKLNCEKESLTNIFQMTGLFQVRGRGTSRNNKLAPTKNSGFLFHLADSLPNGSYPFANLFRAPFAMKLQREIERGNMNFKSPRHAVVPIYPKEMFLAAKKSIEDVGLYSFIVVSDYEDLIENTEMIAALKTHPKREQMQNDANLLVATTGFVDFHIKNVALESEKGRVVLFDTEPLYGEVLLNKDEYDSLTGDYKFFLEFYDMNKEELSQYSALHYFTNALKEKSEKESIPKKRRSTPDQ